MAALCAALQIDVPPALRLLRAEDAGPDRAMGWGGVACDDLDVAAVRRKGEERLPACPVDLAVDDRCAGATLEAGGVTPEQRTTGGIECIHVAFGFFRAAEDDAIGDCHRGAWIGAGTILLGAVHLAGKVIAGELGARGIGHLPQDPAGGAVHGGERAVLDRLARWQRVGSGVVANAFGVRFGRIDPLAVGGGAELHPANRSAGTQALAPDDTTIVRIDRPEHPRLLPGAQEITAALGTRLVPEHRAVAEVEIFAMAAMRHGVVLWHKAGSSEDVVVVEPVSPFDPAGIGIERQDGIVPDAGRVTGDERARVVLPAVNAALYPVRHLEFIARGDIEGMALGIVSRRVRADRRAGIAGRDGVGLPEHLPVPGIKRHLAAAEAAAFVAGEGRLRFLAQARNTDEDTPLRDDRRLRDDRSWMVVDLRLPDERPGVLVECGHDRLVFKTDHDRVPGHGDARL